MAKKKRNGGASRLKDRRPIPYDFKIDREVSYTLTEYYNNFIKLREDLEPLDPEWVHDRLLETFNGVDIEVLLEDDFARGVIMGQLGFLFEMESAYGKA